MISDLRFVCYINNNPQRIITTKKFDLSLIYSLEAEFFILADDKVFYSDKYFNIIEMLIELREPINKLKEIEYFNFVSVDHDEPLLEFYKCCDNIWELNSIWSNIENEKICFCQELLECAYKDLCYNVNEWLQRFYNITLEKLS